jgi:hypothetical protein
MPGFTITEQINRPRHVVWEAMLDPKHWLQIVEGLNSVRLLTTPPIKLGSRFEEVRTLRGRTERFIVEVTAFELGRVYAASVFYAGAEFRYTYTFEDAPGGGTAATMQADVIPRSFAARTLFRPLMGIALRAMEKHDADHLERLKALVEAEPMPD